MNEARTVILEDQEQLRRALSVALERQRRELLIKQHAIDTSLNGIMLTDLEGQVDYVNPSFLTMWGYESSDEVLGKNSREFCTINGSNEPIGTLMKKTGGGWRSELKAQRKDGLGFELEIIASFIKDTQGNPIGIMFSFIDITERKHLEEEFRQAQKMEAIGTLAGGIAHDFNNLLMTIQGCTSLMLLDVDRSNSHYEKLKAIEQQVQSGSDLTKHLLGFARRGRYNVKPTDLNELVERTCSMFGRTRKEITIHKKLQEDIWTVEVDQGQIEQTLLNLYLNAGQAMPGGGDLYVETKNTTLDKKYAKPYRIKPGKYLKVSVTDTGFGMDEATHKRIFEPFFTTKEMGRGTGLGLASVYGIIKNHGGAINVTSKKGHGTTFRIYMPISNKQVKKERRTAGDVLVGTDTILLVDDEEAVLDWTGQLIKALGYTVLEAKGGREAVDIYKRNRDVVDLVILDVVMPGMSGGETFDILKGIDADVKVLLSSGYSIDGEAAKIMERGCNGFIPKPFNIKELSEKIRKILKKE
jgi:PAS domain S-box-containing protein